MVCSHDHRNGKRPWRCCRLVILYAFIPGLLNTLFRSTEDKGEKPRPSKLLFQKNSASFPIPMAVDRQNPDQQTSQGPPGGYLAVIDGYSGWRHTPSLPPLQHLQGCSHWWRAPVSAAAVWTSRGGTPCWEAPHPLHPTGTCAVDDL